MSSKVDDAMCRIRVRCQLDHMAKQPRVTADATRSDPLALTTLGPLEIRIHTWFHTSLSLYDRIR
jgi:hypothetical protein